MQIQFCVKGIRGKNDSSAGHGITRAEAFALPKQGRGILCNLWRNKSVITPAEIEETLTTGNLNRHLHDYDNFGAETPFISLTAGSIERDPAAHRNYVYDPVDTALAFATDDWWTPGALFYCWTIVAPSPSVPISHVSEAVRDLLIYNEWSPYNLEGEITAKIYIPANQISRVEWWDGSHNTSAPIAVRRNRNYVPPDPLSNVREMLR